MQKVHLHIRHLLFLLIFLIGSKAFAAPLVLNKRYPLNTRVQRGTLVWQFVTFQKSLMGGYKIKLEVYNKVAEKLSYFDDYTEIVDQSIQEKTISKFSLDDTEVSFSSDRYAEVSFQVQKIVPLYYIPVRVEYEKGFEDYLVRFRFFKGKFMVASRLLQQGRIITPDLEKSQKAKIEEIEKKTEENKDKEVKPDEGSVKIDTEKLKGEDSKVIKQVMPAQPPNYKDPSDIEFDDVDDIQEKLVNPEDAESKENSNESSEPTTSEPETEADESSGGVAEETSESNTNASENQSETGTGSKDEPSEESDESLEPTNDEAPTEAPTN